jgi:hypothetical protein
MLYSLPEGAIDIRENQAMVNAAGNVVGYNVHPDGQYTIVMPGGSPQRYYFQVISSNSPAKLLEMISNDPSGIFIINDLNTGSVSTCGPFFRRFDVR